MKIKLRVHNMSQTITYDHYLVEQRRPRVFNEKGESIYCYLSGSVTTNGNALNLEVTSPFGEVTGVYFQTTFIFFTLKGTAYLESNGTNPAEDCNFNIYAIFSGSPYLYAN